METKEEFVKVCGESDSMAQAAVKLGLHFNTFKRRAEKYDCYTPNQSGKGMKKKGNGSKIPLNEIIEGKHPQYQTYKLKNRLIKKGLKENRCEVCDINEWNGEELKCELDHIDGNRSNHSLDNLRVICPNCHSQTETFRGKKR